MEFLRRQQQASLAYARKTLRETLREMLDAADGADDARLKVTKDEARELLKQGRALEDALPSGPDSADPVVGLRRSYVTAVYHIRRISRDLMEASDAKDGAGVAAAKEAARELLGRRLQKP